VPTFAMKDGAEGRASRVPPSVHLLARGHSPDLA
jgi:hypothetical protein